MNIEKYNQWLSLLANFGVVAGIIFLAIEIRQNQASLEEANTLSRLSATSAAFDYNDRHRTFILENENLMEAWIKGRQKNSLTEIEAAQFESLCANLYWGNATLYERYLALGNDEGAQATAQSIANGIQNYSGLEECFINLEATMRSYGHNLFVQSVLNLAGK